MPLNWPPNAEHHVPAYQISALPYVTSSIISMGQVHRYDFNYVTRFINVVNVGAGAGDKIAVSFTERGLRPDVGNFFSLAQNVALHEELRLTTLFVSCSAGTNVDYQLLCGLTTIPTRNFLPITGSNGHQGVG